MTDNNHTITPPPELVEQWECEYHHMAYGPDLSIFISEKAARWGADQELEACCEVLARELNEAFQAGADQELKACCKWIEGEIGAIDPKDLFTARRPKSPSLKEQALAVVENSEICDHLSIEYADILRRALESLPS